MCPPGFVARAGECLARAADPTQPPLVPGAEHLPQTGLLLAGCICLIAVVGLVFAMRRR